MQKLLSWTISRKMWLLTIFLLFNLVVVGGIAYQSPRGLIRKINELANIQLPAVRLMTLTDMMHDGIRASVYSGFLAAENYDVGSLKEIQEELQGFSKDIRAHVEGLKELDLDPELKSKIAASLPALESYVVEANGIMDLIVAHKKADAVARLPGFTKKFEALEKDLGLLGELIEKNAESSRQNSIKMGNDSEQLNLLLTAAGLFVGLVASFFLIRQLYEQLSKITNVMTREAESQTIASRHIATSAHLLTLSTTEQGSAIEQTVSSMDEMAAMLSQTTQNAERSRVVSEKAQIDAKQGQIVIGKMKTAMEEIWANNQTLESLVGLINEIQFKTRVINDIVFETRLLSFNASIEAARAGVHGKGFAVVAEEVGKLALMSGKAADEIRALLENSTRQVSSIVKNTQERVTVGKNISEECAVVFNSMDDILTNIGKAIANIVVATKEQEVGVKQSNLAMAEIDRIIQKNSINAGDLAAQASKLGDGGKSLNAAVVDIRKLVFGNQSDNGSKESAHRILKSSEVQPEKNGFHKEVGDDSILTPKTNGEHREPGSSSADDIASGSANPKRNDSGWRKSA